MDNNETQFKDGFNNGYLIAKHQPDLFAKLEKNLDSHNDYVQGLLFGKKEFEAEKNIIQFKDLKDRDKESKEDKDFDKSQ